MILITLDALGYKLFAQNLDLMPNLRGLVSRGVSFENAFSVGASTHFGFPGLIAGVYPYHFGIGLDKRVRSLPDVLKDEGYSTAFINEMNVLITPYFGYGLNLDYQQHFFSLPDSRDGTEMRDTLLEARQARAGLHTRMLDLLRRIYYSLSIRWVRDFGVTCVNLYRFLSLRFKEGGHTVAGRRKLHGEFLNEILGFISERFGAQQFLWIHTVINHLPYLPPEEGSEFRTSEVDYLNGRGLTSLVNPGIARRLKGLYIESFKSTDHFIGQVLQALSRKGLLEKSILVVTADHGEEFMEEGFFGHEPESSSDRLLHVPLIFYGPGFFEPGTVHTPVSTLDILPTVCDLLAIGPPSTCRGISLKDLVLGVTPDPDEPEATSDRSLFSESWRWHGMLDRSAGHLRPTNVFTVRRGIHRLKVTREQRPHDTVIDKLELRDWVNDEPLDLSSHRPLADSLLYLLAKHIHEEGAFAERLRIESERKRIKSSISRLRKIEGP